MPNGGNSGILKAKSRPVAPPGNDGDVLWICWNGEVGVVPGTTPWGRIEWVEVAVSGTMEKD
jgi:hypothetical protein